MGANDNGTYFSAKTFTSVHPKNKPYPTITRGFKYSFNLFGYSFWADFFKSIWETEAIKTEPIIISEYINILLIIAHHQIYTNQNN